MLRNFYKIALRNLLNLWVKDELSYDRFFLASERMYRVTEHQTISGNQQHLATTSGPLAATILKDIPDVEAAVRVVPRKKSLLAFDEKSFYEKGLIYSDPAFCKVFNVKWLQGNKSSALNTPNSIILSSSLASKYFNSTHAIDSPSWIKNWGVRGLYTYILLKWFLGNQWLMNFAYRIQLNLLILPIAGLFIIIIAFITLSGLLIKAAFVNPINIIRENN